MILCRIGVPHDAHDIAIPAGAVDADVDGDFVDEQFGSSDDEAVDDLDAAAPLVVPTKQWCETAYMAGNRKADDMMRQWNFDAVAANASGGNWRLFLTRRSFCKHTRGIGFWFRRPAAMSLQLAAAFDKQNTAFAHSGYRTSRHAVTGTLHRHRLHRYVYCL